MNRYMIWGAMSAAAMLSATAATAAPVQFSGNGHYYEYIAGPVDWFTARDAAAASTWLGAQGYLATVTSAAENAFLVATFGTATNDNPNGTVGWLGGTDEAVEGDWVWVTGPEAGQLFYRGQAPTGTTITYANWGPGLPDNDPSLGGEDYLVFRESGWNDLRTMTPSGAPVLRGYFIEYGTAAVPEPASWAMLIGGFASIGGVLRRRRSFAAALS